MKVYPLLFSLAFPAGHLRAGSRTMFVENIDGGGKLHTIRANYAHWHKIISSVQAGEGFLSLRYWTGRPYMSRQHEFARLNASDGIGIERVIDFANHGQVSAHNDPNVRAMVYLDDLADNDGLNGDDFRAWFPDWGKGVERAIIHLSPLRYMEAEVWEPTIQPQLQNH